MVTLELVSATSERRQDILFRIVLAGLELREERPHLALGPGLGAAVAAAIHIARRVTSIERTPTDGIPA